MSDIQSEFRKARNIRIPELQTKDEQHRRFAAKKSLKEKTSYERLNDSRNNEPTFQNPGGP